MFLDTSGLLCVARRQEKFHDLAAALFKAIQPKLTTDYVLVEFVALAQARGLRRDKTLVFLEKLLENADVQVAYVGQELFALGINLLHQRPDKTYSLCDAISFVIMRAAGETEALTTDKHFEQEGFRRLLSDADT